MSPLYKDTSLDLHLHSSIASSATVSERQTWPQPDVASVVLSNVSRINSKWSSSTTCWEFFHQFVSAKTLQLIHIFLLKCDHFGTDPFLRLMPSAPNGCYGSNLRWYPVLSKLACYKSLCRFLSTKIIILANICWSFKNFVWVPLFESQYILGPTGMDISAIRRIQWIDLCGGGSAAYRYQYCWNLLKITTKILRSDTVSDFYDMINTVASSIYSVYSFTVNTVMQFKYFCNEYQWRASF